MSTNITTSYRLPTKEFSGNRKYAITSTGVEQLYNFLNTPSSLAQLILSITNLFESPKEYIVSLRGYPFDVKTLATSSTVETITVGDHKSLGFSGSKLNNIKTALKLGEATITKNHNSFLDYEPYTKIEAWIPYVGFVQLPVNEVMGKTIEFYYAIDYDSGKCVVYLQSNGYIIDQWDGTIGFDIPIGASNMLELSRNLLLNGLSSVVALGSATSGITATTGLLSSSINAIQNGQVHITKGKSSSGSKNFFCAPQNIFLIITHPNPISVTDFNKIKGKPCGKTYVLNTLTGFTKVETVHLSGFDSATDTEINMIESLLKEGVHI